VNVEGVNIMTLEDPVEYPVAMMRQTSVSDAVKLDFANGIRSIMRQDPDIILVGEIRDRDTADMAFRAAMTGHQVFTTLHTNSALGAIPAAARHRDPAGHHRGQRDRRRRAASRAHALHALPRRAPAVARREAHPRTLARQHRDDLPTARRRLPALQQPRLPRPDGRHGNLHMDADIDELVARRATGREIRRLAVEKGFRSLAEEGITRVLDGSTGLAELSRSVDLTGRLI
jgi:type II secretory ATPase GspE/PulE/Tfp pilus assembly ATPase PilB-like protein